VIILLVEDEPLIAMSLEAGLSDAGHHVLGPASTAGRALALAEDSRPELALVNIELRDGSSGADLARTMRARWGVPSLFISGQVLEARRNEAAALGYIAKPYTPEIVLAAVEVVKAIIEGRRPPPPIPRGLELFG